MFRFWASHMWPEAAGTSCKIFWAHKTLWLSIWDLKLHAKIFSPCYRPNFVQKPSFLPIFGWSRAFWLAGSSRKPAGGLIKKFDNAFTTFKHPTIMLEWSDDPKGCSNKTSPPKKRSFFGGGGKQVNIALNPLCF